MFHVDSSSLLNLAFVRAIKLLTACWTPRHPNRMRLDDGSSDGAARPVADFAMRPGDVLFIAVLIVVVGVSAAVVGLFGY